MKIWKVMNVEMNEQSKCQINRMITSYDIQQTGTCVIYTTNEN